MSGLQKAAAIISVILLCATTLNLVRMVGMFMPHETFREKAVREQVDYINRYAPQDPVFTFSDSAEHFAPAMLEVEKRPYPPFHSMRMALGSWESGEGASSLYTPVRRFFEDSRPRLVFASRINGPTEKGCLPVPLEMMLTKDPEFSELWHRYYHKIGTIRGPKEAYWLENEQKVKPDLVWLDVYLRQP